MIKKYCKYRVLVILCFVMGIGGIFSNAAMASEEMGSLNVEFQYRGRPFSITGERTALHTYVFNKGAPQKISITTLNWAPYIGENICKQGWVQQLTVALLASRGYEITATFLPWARTIRMAETGSVDILYPEYFIEPTAPSDVYEGTKRVEHLALSRKLPGGNIVFMKRKGEADRYKGNLLNLENEKIVVVGGYQNTPEFDALMDMDFFDISKSVDDLMNIKKLINNRINLIIGDPAVIRFSIASGMLSQNEKNRIRQSIEVVQPVIQYNHLYYAISKKKPFWKHTLKLVNTAIKEFEASGLMFDIIKTVNRTCGYQMNEVFEPRL